MQFEHCFWSSCERDSAVFYFNKSSQRILSVCSWVICYDPSWEVDVVANDTICWTLQSPFKREEVQLCFTFLISRFQNAFDSWQQFRIVPVQKSNNIVLSYGWCQDMGHFFEEEISGFLSTSSWLDFPFLMFGAVLREVFTCQNHHWNHGRLPSLSIASDFTLAAGSFGGSHCSAVAGSSSTGGFLGQEIHLWIWSPRRMSSYVLRIDSHWLKTDRFDSYTNLAFKGWRVWILFL